MFVCVYMYGEMLMLSDIYLVSMMESPSGNWSIVGIAL